jgi:hypothetical protein
MHRTIVLFALALGACKTGSLDQACESTPPPSGLTRLNSSGPTPTGHYCDLGALSPEETARLKALVPKLAAATTDHRELENGYEFGFSGQFKEAGELVDGARRCCPTVAYDVSFAPRSGPASLKITGGPGAKEFIREEFAPLFK